MLAAALAAFACAACLAALALVTAEKAEAAFPGKNGRIAFARVASCPNSCLYDIFTVNPDGSGLNRLTEGGTNEEAAWSPDGRKIAFVRNRTGGFSKDVYVMNADGSGLTRITQTRGGERHPAWSADGRRVVFSLNGDLYDAAVSRPLDPPRQLTSGDDFESNPAWSPNGNKIAFYRSDRELGPSGVFVMDAAPEGPDNVAVRLVGGYEPNWSPNGEKIVYSSFPEGGAQTELYKVDSAGGSDPVRLTTTKADEDDPIYSPNQAKIAYLSTAAGKYGVKVMGSDGKNPVNLTRARGELDPDWQPLP